MQHQDFEATSLLNGSDGRLTSSMETPVLLRPHYWVAGPPTDNPRIYINMISESVYPWSIYLCEFIIVYCRQHTCSNLPSYVHTKCWPSCEERARLICLCWLNTSLWITRPHGPSTGGPCHSPSTGRPCHGPSRGRPCHSPSTGRPCHGFLITVFQGNGMKNSLLWV